MTIAVQTMIPQTNWYDAWFVPVTQWIEQLWPPRIGKNILIVARKNVP